MKKILHFTLPFCILIFTFWIYGRVPLVMAVADQTLRGSAFSDDDPEDTHRASQWQVTKTSGNYSSPAVDSGADTSNKTSYTVASSLLSAGTTYYWRVRYQDNHQIWSDWSSEKSFTTEGGETPTCQSGSGQGCVAIVEPPIDGTTDDTTDDTTGTTTGTDDPPGVIIDPDKGLQNQEQPFPPPASPALKLTAEPVKDNEKQTALFWKTSDLPSEARNLIAIKKSRQADWLAAVAASQTIQFFKIAENDGKIFDNVKIADLQEIYPLTITRPRLEILSQDSQDRWHLAYQDGKKIYYTFSDDASGSKWSAPKEVFATALPIQKSLNLVINNDNQPLILGLSEDSKSIVQINPQDNSSQIIFRSESSSIDYLSAAIDASGKNIYLSYLLKGAGEHDQPREIFYSANNSQQKISISDSTWLNQTKLLKADNKTSTTPSLPGIRIYRNIKRYYLINFDASKSPGGLNIVPSKTNHLLPGGWQDPEVVVANAEEGGLKGGTDFDGVVDENNNLIIGWTGFNDKKVYLRRREVFGKWSDIVQIGEAKSRYSAVKLAAGSTLVAFDDDFYLINDNNQVVWQQNRPIYPIDYWEIYLDDQPAKKVTTATAVQTVLEDIPQGKHRVQLKLVFQNGEILTSNTVEIIGGKKIVVSGPTSQKRTSWWLEAIAAFLAAGIIQEGKWLWRWKMLGNSHPWSWLKMYLSHFLALCGWCRRREPWGKVIDAGSEKPIPLVSVSLIEAEMKRMAANSLTELDGLFVFTPVEKTCFLMAEKQGYQRFQSPVFSANQSPNSLIKLPEDKLLYQNLRWINSLRFGQATINWLTIIQWFILAGGGYLAIVSFIQQQTLTEYAALALYFILIFWEIYRLLFREKSFGQITDSQTNQPVAFAILRLFNDQGNLVATEVTDRRGRYSFLLKHGRYVLECGRPNYQTARIKLHNPSRKIRALIRNDIQLKLNG